ncbi:MAG: hypothetical protein R3300_19270 [Candidatus Promineifilaceae bacterium]|nr:hypothetical protein [Candidatus Promineifilaceae bacterium]
MTPQQQSIATAQKDAYQAAHEGAVMVDRSALGMLKFVGQTRLDLINRMSTQKVDALEPGQGAATVLTTDIGRIIDRLILYAGSQAAYCLTGENNNDAIARYLMRFVFFNDDFHIEDLSQETFIFGVYGIEAQASLAGLLDQDVAVPRHHWREITLADRTAYLHRTDPVAGEGYFITGQQSDAELIWDTLKSAGLVPIQADDFEYLRIESGLPRFDHELTQDYIPLETELWADVSFNKGCYTGQEIIARLESRGRLAKRLVRLFPEAPISAGAELRAGNRVAGAVTSAAAGPEGPLALGYVKTSFLDESDPILAAEDVPVKVVGL